MLRPRATSVPAYLAPLAELGATLVRRPAARVPAAAVRHHRAGRPRFDLAPTRGAIGCRCAGWPTRRRWRWPTRGCWIRCGRWPTTTASPGCRNRLSYKERLAHALEQASRDQQAGRRVLHRSRPLQPDQRHPRPRGRATSCCGRWPPGSGPAAGSGRTRWDPPTRRLAPEVARLGGDEFTVIMPGLHDPEDAAKLARRILVELRPSDPARRARALRQRQHRHRHLSRSTARTSIPC